MCACRFRSVDGDVARFGRRYSNTDVADSGQSLGLLGVHVGGDRLDSQAGSIFLGLLQTAEDEVSNVAYRLERIGIRLRFLGGAGGTQHRLAEGSAGFQGGNSNRDIKLAAATADLLGA